jgi:AAHS family 4-hydroxybenzoate transporter-like MFS transporter
MHASIGTVFLVLAVPGAVAAVALWIKRDADGFANDGEARTALAH